ncbi:HTH_Tnp_Tc3_2 domain-containing protein [Trichonephila clavipes]|nr:HTH_Tnp_Tc3_2 domain-containing protein [Trichonephila clavipes]
MTVIRIWNRWFQDSNTERRAGSQRPSIISSREARHVTRMALMDRAATSRALSQELGLFARQQIKCLAVSLASRSPDLSPMENFWSMVAERLAHHHTAVITVDELWHCVEAAWASVLVHAIQSLTQCPGV